MRLYETPQRINESSSSAPAAITSLRSYTIPLRASLLQLRPAAFHLATNSSNFSMGNSPMIILVMYS